MDWSQRFIFGGVSYLPELHSDGSVQLEEPRVKVKLLALWFVQIDGRRLTLVLLDQTKMVPQL